jgi:hypothetical protein
MRVRVILVSTVFIGLLGLAVYQAGAARLPQPQVGAEERRAAELHKLELLAEFGEPDFVGQLSAGGPDTFGYRWIDSDEPGGPTYSWIDITTVGTPVPFPSYRDDGNVGPIPIGFNFPFYGNTFNELYVCTNGWLSFTNNIRTTYTNQPLPNAGTAVPENLLAPWWDDMVYDESDGNEAFYYFDGTHFIIEYFVRRIAGFTPPYYRFQVILYPNGNILYQYHTLGVVLGSSTIGIQNATKDDGLTVVYNDGSYPHEELAILLRPRPEMEIDIMPGSARNPINLESRGLIPVAILTTDDFDALNVDATTITFGPDGASIAHREAHVKDVDWDGDLDLLTHFRTRETGIEPFDAYACLVAELFDGTMVEACDAISTVP